LSNIQSLDFENLSSTQIASLKSVITKYSDGPVTGIFTDGSCFVNPGPGGWGAVQVRDDVIIHQLSGEDSQTTNNRMELTAMIAGLRMISSGEHTVIYSDSQLVVNTLTTWARGWATRGWRRKTGEIANLDLVQEAYNLFLDRPSVEVKWIRAHHGSKWNEYADALASLYMENIRE
jgi:ribonuclease HI